MALTAKNGIEISIFLIFLRQFRLLIDSNMLVFSNTSHLNNYLAGH